MSLLNQVLLDLEDRNEQNISEQHQLDNLKLSPTPKHRAKPYLLITVILLFILIIVFIVLNNTKTNTIPEATKLEKIVRNEGLIIPESMAQGFGSTGVLEKQAHSKLRNYSSSTPVESKPTPTYKQTKAVTKTKLVEKPKVISKTTKPMIKKVKIPQPALAKKPVEKKSAPLNSKQLSEQLFKSALKQKTLITRQLKLEQTLELNALHLKARLLLANTLLQQGLSTQAGIVLDHGIKLSPQKLALINLRSQLFLQKKQASSALTLLHQVDANYIQNETYLGLLAAAYQQINNNIESLNIYQKLLRINPDKAEYWLGLAIGYENQANKQQALNAYQQALNKNPLRMEIVSYIKQRISILK